MERESIQKENGFVDWVMEHADSQEIDIVLKQLLECSPDIPEVSRQGFERFVQKTGITPRRDNRSIVFKIASCVFLLSSIVLGWFALAGQREEKEWKEVCTAFGETNTVLLNDGTIVKLGGGSKIIYPVFFEKDLRKVYIEGEAFLDVAKDVSRPFIVSAGSMDIRVLGTKFNVNSGFGQPEDEVALVDGSVNISFKDGDKRSMNLDPGEMLKVDKINGVKEVKSFVVNYYNSLSNESGFFFYDATLREITETLSLRSGIPIVINDNTVAEKKYYAMFINGESVHDILNSLNFRHQFNVSITGDIICINKADN